MVKLKFNHELINNKKISQTNQQEIKYPVELFCEKLVN